MASIRNLMIRLGVELDDRGTKKLGGSLERLTGQVKGLGVAMIASFGAATIIDFAKDSIRAASDLGESMSKNNVVFGKSSKAVVDFSRTAATSMGQSTQQALEATATFGNLFVSMKIGQPQAAGMSTKMVQLASDMASFNNVSPEETLDALRSGLVGETEPLRRFGVNLNEAGLKAEVMRLGLGKVGPTLTASQKAQAAYSLILQQSKTAQGDFARTSGGLANQQRILNAQFIDAKAAIGEALLPVALALTKWANSTFIPALRTSVQWVRENTTTIKTLAIVIGSLVGVFVAVKTAIFLVNTAMKLARGATLAWAVTTKLASAATGGLQSGLSTASGAWDTMRLRTMYASEAIKKTGGPIKALNAGIGGMGGAVSKAKGALSGIGGMLASGGPWGLAIAGAITAVTWFATRNDEAEQRVSGLTDAIKEDSGVLGTNTRAKIANTLQTQGMLDKANKLGISSKLITDAVLGEGDAMAQVDLKLKSLSNNVVVYGGRAGQGTTSTKIMTGAVLDLFNSIHNGNGELTQAQRKQKQLNDAMGDTTTTGGRTVNVIDELGKSAVIAAGDVDKLNTRVSKFNSITGDADAAGIDFRNTIDDMSAAFKKNGLQIDRRTGAFNLNTRKGRENNLMLIDAVRKAGDHADKVFKQTNSVKAANKTFNDEIRVLRNVIAKHGDSRGALQRLIDKYIDAKNKINNATNGIKNRKVTIKVQADGTVNLPGGTKASIFAKGGVLPGYTPGRDVHTFTSPTGGTLGLSGGEAVMRPEWTRAVGTQNVNKLNQAARTGGVGGVKRELANGVGRYGLGGEGAFFAGGGIISQNSVSGVPAISKGLRKYDHAVGNWTWKAAQKIVKKLNELGIGGPKVQKALKWAKSQSGKPYIWAGVGPRGYDCSGFMGAITNYIHGKSPYSRIFSTHSFGSQGPSGFRRNLKSGFTVGVTDAGVGHMAGTLGKTNVESNGSQGVHYGPGARGTNSGLFTRRYGLKMAQGGVLPPPWKMDKGGVFTPGSAAVNTTREPEAVFTRKQWDKGGGARGGDTINIHVHATPGTDRQKLGKEVYELLKDYKRGSKRGGSLGL